MDNVQINSDSIVINDRKFSLAELGLGINDRLAIYERNGETFINGCKLDQIIIDNNPTEEKITAYDWCWMALAVCAFLYALSST